MFYEFEYLGYREIVVVNVNRIIEHHIDASACVMHSAQQIETSRDQPRAVMRSRDL